MKQLPEGRAAVRRHPSPGPPGATSLPCRPGNPRQASLVCLLAILMTGLASGCATKRPAPGGSANAISELIVIGLPAAVNLDDKPGPDGLMMRLFAADRREPRAIAIRSGRLEIAAYPGTPHPAALPKPFHVWTFSPRELSACEVSTSLGTGYNLVLSWAPRPLPANRVTVIARYLPPGGTPVVSAPNSITASP